MKRMEIIVVAVLLVVCVLVPGGYLARRAIISYLAAFIDSRLHPGPPPPLVIDVVPVPPDAPQGAPYRIVGRPQTVADMTSTMECAIKTRNAVEIMPPHLIIRAEAEAAWADVAVVIRRALQAKYPRYRMSLKDGQKELGTEIQCAAPMENIHSMHPDARIQVGLDSERRLLIVLNAERIEGDTDSAKFHMLEGRLWELDGGLSGRVFLDADRRMPYRSVHAALAACQRAGVLVDVVFLAAGTQDVEPPTLEERIASTMRNH